jgi:hypothetical protein
MPLSQFSLPLCRRHDGQLACDSSRLNGREEITRPSPVRADTSACARRSDTPTHSWAKSTAMLPLQGRHGRRAALAGAGVLARAPERAAGRAGLPGQVDDVDLDAVRVELGDDHAHASGAPIGSTAGPNVRPASGRRTLPNWTLYGKVPGVMPGETRGSSSSHDRRRASFSGKFPDGGS